ALGRAAGRRAGRLRGRPVGRPARFVLSHRPPPVRRPRLRVARVRSAEGGSGRPQGRQVDRVGVEHPLDRGEQSLALRAIPARVGEIAVELADEFLAREGRVAATADVGLALLEDAAVVERHADVAGEGTRVGVVRV
ncbi:MAG: hypothetical protein ACK559_02875, partial [bacterium]